MSEKTGATGGPEPTSQSQEGSSVEKKVGKKWAGRMPSVISDKWRQTKRFVEKKVSLAKSRITQAAEDVSKKFSAKKTDPLSEATGKLRRVSGGAFEGVRAGHIPPRRPLPQPPTRKSSGVREARTPEAAISDFQKRIDEAKVKTDLKQRERDCRSFIAEFGTLCKQYHTEVNQLLQCFDAIYALLGERKIKDSTEVSALDRGLKAILPNPLEDPSKIWEGLIGRCPHLATLLKSIRLSAVNQKILDSFGEWSGDAGDVKRSPLEGQARKAFPSREGYSRAMLLKTCQKAEDYGQFTDDEKAKITAWTNRCRKRIDDFRREIGERIP